MRTKDLVEHSNENSNDFFICDTQFRTTLSWNNQTEKITNYPKGRCYYKKIDIFKFKYLIIPYNTGVHWMTIIIIRPGSMEGWGKQEKS